MSDEHTRLGRQYVFNKMRIYGDEELSFTEKLDQLAELEARFHEDCKRLQTCEHSGILKKGTKHY